MIRQLTKEERELEQKGLDRNEKNLKLLKSNYEYNKDLIDKQNYIRKHDDKWRDYLRNLKDIEDNEILDKIKSEIDLKTEIIKQAKQHLKNGIEVKPALGT